jgi:hypothetical protein
MRPVDTALVHAELLRRGCVSTCTHQTHVKWTTPGGLVALTVGGVGRQSPGVLHHLQDAFRPEFGNGWLEQALTP